MRVQVKLMLFATLAASALAGVWLPAAATAGRPAATRHAVWLMCTGCWLLAAAAATAAAVVDLQRILRLAWPRERP